MVRIVAVVWLALWSTSSFALIHGALSLGGTTQKSKSNYIALGLAIDPIPLVPLYGGVRFEGKNQTDSKLSYLSGELTLRLSFIPVITPYGTYGFLLSGKEILKDTTQVSLSSGSFIRGGFFYKMAPLISIFLEVSSERLKNHSEDTSFGLGVTLGL